MKSIAESSEELLPQEAEVQAAQHAYTDNQDHLDKIPIYTCEAPETIREKTMLTVKSKP